MENNKTKILTGKFSLILVFNYHWLKISISVIVILISSFVYSQPSMTSKEGFYYLLKVNQEGLTDNAIKNNNNQTLNLRWFDLYINLFDKANYNYYSKDEFKWPDYSKKILAEISQGIKSSDFNKLYSYRNKETLGKYNFELGGFPITRTGRDITIFSDDHITFEVTLRLGYWANSTDIDLFLKMDPKRAERLVESMGQNRTVDAKVIYNVVNRNMTDLNKWDEKYLGIYVHKIIFMNGSEVLGEITSKIDYEDKVNLIKTVAPPPPPPPPDKKNMSNINSTLNTTETAAVMSIIVNTDGKVFLSINRQTKRAYLLKEMANRYSIAFTDYEIEAFSRIQSFGVPIYKMKEFLAAKDPGKTFFQTGIPIDSTDNQLSLWILYATQDNPSMEITIKTDEGNPNSVVKEVINHINAIRTQLEVVTTVFEEVEEDPADTNTSFFVVEQMPQYLGGDAEILNFIKANMKYPEAAKTKKIEGRVIVRFVVNPEGKAERVELYKRVHPLLDAEAVRIVSMLSGFKPGIQGGKAVYVWYQAPVYFNLSSHEPIK